jgi:anti-sigma regulatory factor (Ser/Thr protein kinase)
MTSLHPFGLLEEIPDDLRVGSIGTTPSGRWPTRHTGAPLLAREVLEAQPTAARAARHFNHATLGGWGLEPLTEDAATIASELVTNALKYGSVATAPFENSSSMQLVLLGHPRRLTLVVTQSSVGRPTVKPATVPEPPNESGYGLNIVTALSASWGWARLATGGTAVWATLQSPGARGLRSANGLNGTSGLNANGSNGHGNAGRAARNGRAA